MKPLLEQMLIKNIRYSWGFPACLIGYKDGRSARLRFPEELKNVCERLDLQAPDLPGWYWGEGWGDKRKGGTMA